MKYIHPLHLPTPTLSDHPLNADPQLQVIQVIKHILGPNI